MGSERHSRAGLGVARRAGLGAAVVFLLAWAAPAGAQQTAEQTPTGERQAPQSSERPLIAVLNLEPAGASAVEVSAASDRLREELLRTGKFALIERERLDQVLEEQTIQQAGCSGKECALQVGRVLGVGKIITGRATKLGPDSWQISALMIDVQTAETERAESVIHEGRFVDLLRQGIPDLAARLAGERRGAPPVAAQAPPPVEAKAQSEPAPSEEPEPGPAPTVRLWGSPLSSFAMTLTLSSSTGQEVTETFNGLGASLGADFFVSREFALWLAMHFGSITAWGASAGGATVTLENVSGSFFTLGGGADLVLGEGPWRFLLGGGLFNTSAAFRGDEPNSGFTFDSDASVFGVILDLRGDYTFDNGWLVGLGLQVGVGGASGQETTGASSASGVVAHFFIPVGYSF